MRETSPRGCVQPFSAPVLVEVVSVERTRGTPQCVRPAAGPRESMKETGSIIMAAPESKKKQVVSGRNHQRLSMASLPSDVVTRTQLDDLRIAFSIYEIEKTGTILLSNLRVLLWNFGYWRISKKDMEKLLRSFDFDMRKTTIEWKDVLAIISKKYSSNWSAQETHDTFVALDRRDRGSVSQSDLKARLQGILDIGISDSDLAEVYTLAEVEPGSALHLEEVERIMRKLQ